MKLKKLYSFVMSPIRLFIFYTRKFSFMRKIGKLLYKLGLYFSLKVFKGMREIESIYLKTNLEKDFIIGESDIDLAIIVKEMSLREETKFLRKYLRRFILIRTVFPFISYIELFFKKEFENYQKLRYEEIFQKDKHFENWKLIYGKENRLKLKNNETKPSSYVIRDCYENILLNIYEAEVNEEENFRRLHRATFNIIRALFIKENKRDTEDTEEYKKFLADKQVSRKFISDFFNMPKKDYSYEKRFLSLILFYNIKLIEKLGGKLTKKGKYSIENEKQEIAIKEEVEYYIKNIDKKNLKSIYLSPIFNKKTFYLYLVIKDLDYNQFKKLFESVLENISLLSGFKKEIRKGIKDRFAQDFKIFPIVVTENMLSNSVFIDGFYPYESVNFNFNSKKLFGKNIKIGLNLEHIKEKFNLFVHLSLSICGIKYILLSNILRPEYKDDIILNYLDAHRDLKKEKIILKKRKYDFLKNKEEKYMFARKILKQN